MCILLSLAASYEAWLFLLYLLILLSREHGGQNMKMSKGASAMNQANV
jgi:hypothetical protein